MTLKLSTLDGKTKTHHSRRHEWDFIGQDIFVGIEKSTTKFKFEIKRTRLLFTPSQLR